MNNIHSIGLERVMQSRDDDNGRCRLLIVDDEPMVTRGIALALKDRAEVMAVHNARDAVEALEQERYCAVVADVVLKPNGSREGPDRAGLQVLEDARRRRLAPVRVALTGYPEADIVQRTREAGAIYMGKPLFTPLTLLPRRCPYHASEPSFPPPLPSVHQLVVAARVTVLCELVATAGLTRQQARIAALHVDGHTRHGCIEELGIRQRTYDYHVQELLSRSGSGAVEALRRRLRDRAEHALATLSVTTLTAGLELGSHVLGVWADAKYACDAFTFLENLPHSAALDHGRIIAELMTD
jgi:DNA-binding NarL/FixJ family response regulator